MKNLNIKLVILLKYQILKRFLQKTMLQIDLKKSLLLQKLLVILKTKKLLERLTKKNAKNKSKRVQTEKLIKIKGHNLNVQQKD